LIVYINLKTKKMANNIFIKKFESEINILLREKGVAEESSRMATRGDMMEEVTADLFSRYFPSRCGFGKGQIQDSSGNCSKEVDVVVFDRDSIPPICHGTKSREEKRVEGFFPVESLWYAIEIKKTLNNTKVKEAVDNMKSVRDLVAQKRVPARLLFAYDSDLKDSSISDEFERYKKADIDWNKNPAVNVICIIGRGYMFCQKAVRNRDQKKVLLWKFIEAQDNYFEVACCVGGMVNTITGQAFGSYLFDESSIQTLEEVEI
jgi:hypothetical protein